MTDALCSRLVTTTGTSTAQDRIARHQYAAEVLRARSVLAIACALWLIVGGGLDLLTHDAIGRGSLGFVLVVRGAATAYHAFVLAALWRDPLPPPRVAWTLVAGVFPLTTLALTIISARMGGFASPYVTAVFVILMVQALAIPGPWHRAGVLAAVTAAIWPLGLLAQASFDDGLRAQLDDPAAVTTFVVYTAVVLAAGIVAVWGGHIVWSLRRSVFESRSIGRYRLLGRIGKGGMGEVWRAHDRALRRDVALKILSPDQGRHPGAIARFEREIKATADLDHPHIVRIHDWGVTDDGVWYYAMELLDGADLSTLVKRGGPLPAALVVHLGEQAALALAEAHARGVIHRDVKPGNLQVVTGGDRERAKLLDFGVARIDGAEDEALTHAGAVIGTPGFIAPEVFAGAAATVASDVYGLAATLYYALTGKNPRDAGGVPPSTLVPGIPADLDDALVRALDADPARRPRGADELAIELGSSSLAETWTGGLVAARLAPADQPALEATLDADAPATRGEIPARARRAR